MPNAPKIISLIPLKNFALILFIFLAQLAAGTHNRSGEITYKRIPPFTSNVGGFDVPYYKYEITIILYTDDGTKSSPSSDVADRCTLDSVSFGDGTTAALNRNNGGTPLCPNCAPCGCPNCGELVVVEGGYRVKKNIYITEHVYPGPGSYTIRIFDRNRNEDVLNIPNSGDQPFYVQSLLIVSAFNGGNVSVSFKYMPIDRGCVNRCFYHNPGAFDPDGDSLSFSLTASRGVGGLPINGYTMPDPGSGGTFNINPVTGLLTWCNPQLQGEYNIAFIVQEWRRDENGRRLMGTVMRDMQVLIKACPNNDPPRLVLPPDTCVEAGAFIDKKILFSDPNPGNIVTLHGEAGAFAGAAPQASLGIKSGTVSSASSQFVSSFKWQTKCDHVRNQPYQTVFKVEDNQDPKQFYYATYSIRVLPPPVKNVTAQAQGSSIKLSWDPATCNPAGNKLKQFVIYRQKGCEPLIFEPCKTGVPPTSGLSNIGTVPPGAVSFIDNANGDGLVVGQEYSYIVVAEYEDGLQSFGSAQVCAKLKRDVPVITHVDVLSTSQTGSVQVKWLRPLVSSGNLDLSVFKGPYKFVLKHRALPASTYTPVYTTTKAVFTDLEEAYTHSLINTAENAHEYLIDFYSDTTLVGSSQKASSQFLATSPADRKIDLQWSAKTPWDNYNYIIHRQDPATSTFVTLGTTSLTTYSDTKNIENGKTYCYYITSEGAYSDPGLPKPLINRSQQTCATAIDLTPPVTPTLSVDADCPAAALEITWTDIINQSDDVDSYELFYKPSVSGTYEKVATVKAKQQLLFRNDNSNSFAGCYSVRAIDINKNVGPMSPDFCVDNCPEFELPNVFTPNGDGINDHFKAIKVRQIKQIELSVTDRWGNLVYTTSDPYFQWDGVSQVSKQALSEGTFFFVCDVYEPRIKGLVKRTLRGYIQIVR